MNTNTPQLPAPPNFANAQTIDYILYILITLLTLVFPMFAKKVWKIISQCMHRTKTTNDIYKVAEKAVSDSLNQRSKVASMESALSLLVSKVDEQLTRSDIVEAAASLVRHSDNTPEGIKRNISKEKLTKFIMNYNKLSPDSHLNKKRANTARY